jgi:hypothetical protein
MCRSWKYPVLRILVFFVSDPDPTFHFELDPIRVLLLLFLKVMRIYGSILSVNGHPWLNFDPTLYPTQLLSFIFEADPYPASKSEADPDPDPQHHWKYLYAFVAYCTKTYRSGT